MKLGKIIVAGGYGHVGQQLCLLLAKHYPGQVYAAGRSMEKAERFSRESGGQVLPMELDIRAPFDADKLAGARLLIMCLDQEEPHFVDACLRAGIHYMDISASDSFLTRVEQLQEAAHQGQAVALLSVGLVPGLSNLMAKEAYGLLEHTDRIDITLLLGLGDEHGQAAIEWTIDQLGTDFTVAWNGTEQQVRTFADGRATELGESWGSRRAYRFNFADQHVLSRTLGVPVATRLCLDSAWVTGGIRLLRKLGLTRLLSWSKIRSAAVKSFARWRGGSDAYVLQVEASGHISGSRAVSKLRLEGRKEATVTASAAAAAALALYREEPAPGIYHIEQLLQLSDVLPWYGRGVGSGAHLWRSGGSGSDSASMMSHVQSER